MLLISPETLKLQIDNYFEQIRLNKSFVVGTTTHYQDDPTFAGLALFLGFSSITQLEKYLENPEYENIIRYGMLRCENQYEKLLQKNVATAKVGLKKLGQWEDMPQVTNNFTYAQIVKDLHDRREKRLSGAEISDGESS